MSELRAVVVTGLERSLLQWRVVLGTHLVGEGEDWGPVQVCDYGDVVAEIERPYEMWDGSVTEYVMRWLPKPQA